MLYESLDLWVFIHTSGMDLDGNVGLLGYHFDPDWNI